MRVIHADANRALAGVSRWLLYHSRNLMDPIRWRPVYPRSRTSQLEPGHRVYLHLLGGLVRIAASEVNCADNTCIPTRNRFLYLLAMMGWTNRFVLSWQLDNMLEAAFCVHTLAPSGVPRISNTDRDSQFTSEAYMHPQLHWAAIPESVDSIRNWGEIAGNESFQLRKNHLNFTLMSSWIQSLHFNKNVSSNEGYVQYWYGL